MKLGPLVVGGLVAFGAATGAYAASAPGGSTVESGWWNEASVGPLVAPSTTQSGQLQVSNGFNGPLAFSAIRFSLPPGASPSYSVTVRLTTTGALVGTPAVSACPTAGKWNPGDDQPAASAPGYGCGNGQQAIGATSGSTESWTFPASWATKGTVSVALVPSVGTTTPFSISYTAPTLASIAVTAPAAPPGTGSPPPAPPVTAPSAVTVPAPPAVTTAGSAPVGSSGGAVPVNTLPPGTVPIPNLASPPAASAGGSGPAVVAAPASAPAGGGIAPKPDSRRGARILAFCMLMLTGGALFRLGGQPRRPPRSLLSHRYATSPPEPVSAPATTARGIGRFAKVRTGPPTRI